MRKIIVWKVKCNKGQDTTKAHCLHHFMEMTQRYSLQYHIFKKCQLCMGPSLADNCIFESSVQNTVHVVSILFSTWLLYFHKLIICPWLDQSLRTPIHSPRSISWLICYCGYLHSPENKTYEYLCYYLYASNVFFDTYAKNDLWENAQILTRFET